MFYAIICVVIWYLIIVFILTDRRKKIGNATLTLREQIIKSRRENEL